MLMRLNSTFCRARNPYDFLSIQRGVWARDKTDDNGNINRSRIRIEETLWKAKKGSRLTDVLFWWRNIQESRYWTWNEFFEKNLKVSIVNSKWVFFTRKLAFGRAYGSAFCWTMYKFAVQRLQAAFRPTNKTKTQLKLLLFCFLFFEWINSPSIENNRCFASPLLFLTVTKIIYSCGQEDLLCHWKAFKLKLNHDTGNPECIHSVLLGWKLGKASHTTHCDSNPWTKR